MEQEYDAAQRCSRDDVATALRRLADGVAAGSVAVDATAGPVAVDVPSEVTFEVELEEAEEMVELEAELAWEAGETDGPAIRELDAGGESDTDQGGETDTDQEAGAASDPDAASVTDSNGGSATDSEAATGLVDLVGPATDPAAPAAGSGSKAAFELFRDAADEWRWRLRHRNGNVIADSGEGYDRRAGALNGLESVKSNAPRALVEEESSE